jgi:Leucine-rich repeat (LRR) protein
VNLEQNHLHGQIPLIWMAFTALTTLNLSSNELTGPIPDSIGSLSKLQSLKLGHNYLTGSCVEFSTKASRNPVRTSGDRRAPIFRDKARGAEARGAAELSLARQSQRAGALDCPAAHQDPGKLLHRVRCTLRASLQGSDCGALLRRDFPNSFMLLTNLRELYTYANHFTIIRFAAAGGAGGGDERMSSPPGR